MIESEASIYPSTIPPLLVITDLDGTLLDHFSYSFKSALPALATLRKLEIPLIPNTSKTITETLELRKQLGCDDPFVVENGSAIVLPHSQFPELETTEINGYAGHVLTLGIKHQRILDLLEDLRGRFKFTGFSDMGTSQIRELTGLSTQEALQAKERYYSEPLQWQDSEKARSAFAAALHERGLRSLQGGRFLHVLGNVDKGMATRHLQRIYQQKYRFNIPTVVLGDSKNDIAMLEAGDNPIIIRSPTHDIPKLKSGHKPIVSEQPGPTGWNRCILKLLEQLQLNQGANFHG